MSLVRSVVVCRQGRNLINGWQLRRAAVPVCFSARWLGNCSSGSKGDCHNDTATDTDEHSAILKASLNFVPKLGWSAAALAEGAGSLGLPRPSMEMFPRAGGELVEYFERQSNRELVAFLERLAVEKQLQGSKVIRPAVEHRLRMIIPYMDKWPQAMALKAFPSNAPSSLESLCLLVDDLWYGAGDRSTDLNWYSKRAILAAVYSATELYMVQDSSVDYQDTWDFLDRRLQDTAAFSRSRRQVEESLLGGVELLSAGLTTARNMLGLNSQSR